MNELPLKISFVVASVDRDVQLQECIDSIENAHDYRPNFPIEILVVFQKVKQKKEISTRFPELTAFYYIDKMGLSVARNFAIAKSTGEYLVFIDDDAMVDKDFIEALSKNIVRHDKVNAFCGRIIDPIRDLPFSPLFSNNSIKKLGYLDYQYFMGSAHVLSRKVLDRIGCYDERFGVGSKYFGSEESDIFFRLKAANEQVLYLPDLMFFHYLPTVPKSYVYKYAYAFGAVLTKHMIDDKAHFIAYCLIAFQRTIKAFIRSIQQILFRGRYKMMGDKYHYTSVIKGTYDGIRSYLKNEL